MQEHAWTEPTEWAFQHRVRREPGGPPVAEQFVIGDYGDRYWMEHEDVPEQVLLEFLRLAARVRELEGRAGKTAVEALTLKGLDMARIAALEAENARLSGMLDAANRRLHESVPLDRFDAVLAEASAVRAENAALREGRGLGRMALLSLASSLPEEPLPTADEVYGILTPCPCGDPDRPGHPPGWCRQGRMLNDDTR